MSFLCLQVSTKTKYHDDHHDSYHDDHHGYHANIHEVYRESPEHEGAVVEAKSAGSAGAKISAGTLSGNVAAVKNSRGSALRALGAIQPNLARSRPQTRRRNIRRQRARSRQPILQVEPAPLRIVPGSGSASGSGSGTGTALGGDSSAFFPPPPKQPIRVQSAVPSDLGGMGQVKQNLGMGGGFPGFPGGFDFPEFGSFTKKK